MLKKKKDQYIYVCQSRSVRYGYRVLRTHGKLFGILLCMLQPHVAAGWFLLNESVQFTGKLIECKTSGRNLLVYIEILLYI